MKKVFVGVTGASGTIYGIRLSQVLLELGISVYLSFSKAAKLVASEELNLDLNNFFSDLKSKYFSKKAPEILECTSLNTAPASGSSGISAVFVAPCSVSSLAHIAYGTSRNLIHRAADVALKERKKLVLVLRETPLSLVHIRAMLQVSEAGAIVLPASPAFYTRPKTVEEMVDFVVGKALDVAGIENDLYKRYKTID